MKFVVACKKFFGLKLGQTLRDFLTEVRKLTAKDRAEMVPELEKAVGGTVEDDEVKS